MTLETLDQAQLPHIQRIGLDYRADDRMKGLAMGDGMDAMRAIGEPNNSVSACGLHRTTFEHAAGEAKPKERERLDRGCIKLAETARTWQGGRDLPAAECPPPLTRFPKLLKQGKAAFPAVDSKPDLYYEVRRRLKAPPGVSHDCPMSLP